MTDPSPNHANGDAHDDSLAERLSNAFAEMLGDVPATATRQPDDVTEPTPDSDDASTAGAGSGDATATANVTPEGVVEAALFVGHPDNQPLLPAQITAAVPGVSDDDVQQIVADLNERYRRRESPYEIVNERGGYRLVLREEFQNVSRRVLGRSRSARLSRAAVDVLALVAYMQPVSSDDVSEQRGHPSQAILRQLVRRQLLRIERDPANRRHVYYRTTDRFLKLFHLMSLEDLPRVPDFDPSLE